ncbi:MAG: PQQ-binding-like beta-propeller repeat protein [Planctomycetaceae bacterium]|nr:PQQ-binding-like beta-propeller repeat protein [Planctomycetaceae bacterium]
MGRCFARGLLALLIVGGTDLVGDADAQVRVLQPLNDAETSVRPAAVSPPRELVIAVEEAQAQLQAGETAKALRLLQIVLDHPEDYFTDEARRRSLKGDIHDLLAGLPPEGREDYEVLFGSTAEALRKKAEDEGDESAERELLARYWMTAAAQQVATRRARAAFDSGASFQAGRWYDSVVGSNAYRQSPQAIVQHGLAWLTAERPDRAAMVLAKTPIPAGSVWPQGARRVEPPPVDGTNAGWLLTTFPELKPTPPTGQPVWSVFRGDATRNASALSAGPIGGVAWTSPLFSGYSSWSQMEFGDLRDPREFTTLVDTLAQTLQADNKLLQPGAHPLVIGDLVVARTPFNIEAFDLRTGALNWRSALRNTGMAQALTVPAGPDAEEAEGRTQLRADGYLRELLLRHQTAGLLSSDGEFVYAVEQSPYVEPVERFLGALRPENEVPPVANRLVAYELSSGRVVWELGGPRRDAAQPFAGAYFFGAPTCVGERMYCLAEAGNELRLLQFRETGLPTGPLLEWSQVIAAPQVMLLSGQLRRLSGMVLAAADELLICSTTAGMVVAVDPVRRLLVWGYEYSSLETADRLDPRVARIAARSLGDEPDEDDGRWLDSAPTVASGRVLLTPRDSTELHCLDAVTGELLWKRPRDRSLYVAGVRDQRVLVVGREQVEALDLLTGKPAWSDPLTIAEPSGRGLFVGRQYLLPLSTGEILAIDYDSGLVRVRARLNQGRIPGNLAAGSGALVSQGLGELLAFRRLPDIEVQVAQALEQQPDDPEALALRGELRLHRGDHAAAIADLRKSLSLKPNPQASLVLADLLIAALRTEFPLDRAPIAEIEGLIQDDHQRTEFLCLTGAAYEQRGELLGAFEQYLKLATPANLKHPLTRVSAELTVRRDRMIRGHLWGLYSSASPAERAAIDRELQSRSDKPGVHPNPAEQRYLEYFDGLPHADQVRLQMLAALPKDSIRDHLPDWHRLVLSGDPKLAGYAVARLAQSAQERQAFDEAATWFNRLQREFADVEVLPGRTGASVFSQWKRELPPQFPSAEPTWPAVAFQVDRWRQNPAFRRVVAIEQVGPPHPIYRDWVFQFIEEESQNVVARDAAGRLQWIFPLPEMMFDARQARFSSSNASPQLHSAGPYFALSFGTNFVVFDVAAADASPRYLWHRTLEQPSSNLLQQSPITVRPEFMKSGRRRVRAVDMDADMQFGQLISLSCDQVCYQSGNRVVAADPRTGNNLWIRHNVPQQTEGSADDRAVTLLDTISQEAIVLRAADGELIARRSIPDPHDWIWFRGAQLLTLARAGDQLSLQLVDLVTGGVTWKVPLTTSTRCTVVEDRGVACLDQNGTFRILDLRTGTENTSSMAPRLPDLEFLWVQSEREGYLVVAGSHTSPVRGGNLRGYDGNQVPVTGVVFRLDQGGKQPAWVVEIEPTAFHVIQPASIPLLVFAARRLPSVNAFADPSASPTRLSAMFIDRRNGDVVYQSDEAPAPGVLTMEIDGDHGQITANFLSFAIDFRLTAGSEDMDAN